MKFGKTDTANATHTILAHSLKLADGRIRKGTRLTPDHIKRLVEHDIHEVTVARLEDGDVHEDEAANLLAKAMAGQGVQLGRAATGRVNCYAQNAGLFTLPRERLLACNQVSESITASTLAENLWVEAGKMIATIKIIPYAVPKQTLQDAIDTFEGMRSSVKTTHLPESLSLEKLCVHNAMSRNAYLIQTTLPETPKSVLEKTERITQSRLVKREIELVNSVHCPHDIDDLATHLANLNKQIELDKSSNAWILISGVSATSDRRDVVPQALEQAGGSILRCGIPVDPGNLLMLGTLGGSTVIGIPGCARSLKHNGLDLFMDRLACNVPVTQAWINSLAIGGLRDEIIDRPLPRGSDASSNQSKDVSKSAQSLPVTAILLAGGSSERFGSDNKLLAIKDGKPLIFYALDTILSSQIQRIIIVLGHEALDVKNHCIQYFQDIKEANSTHVEFIVNTDFATGMASSLRTGISYLLQTNMNENSNTTQSAMVFLADMPHIKPTTINRLIDTLHVTISHPATDDVVNPISAIVPTYNGMRGNPVILKPELFDLLLSVDGDTGARSLLKSNPSVVMEMDVNDAGILIDCDTPIDLNLTPST